MTLARREETALIAENIQELEAMFSIAVRQRELLESYIKQQLRPGKHYYKVAGANKAGLTKEGAEIVCLAHGLKPQYVKNAGPDQPPADNAPYQITVTCRLMRGDTFGGEGMGSASSYHSKRGGSSVPRQNDPGLCHNATLKMAQKSAYIAATLNATAASEFFTQDVDEPSTEAAEEADATDPLYCAEHQTLWFKRGNMRGYAHPIGETKEWCNKPADPPTAAPQGQPAATEARQTAQGPAEAQKAPPVRPVATRSVLSAAFLAQTKERGWSDADRAAYVKSFDVARWADLSADRMRAAIAQLPPGKTEAPPEEPSSENLPF